MQINRKHKCQHTQDGEAGFTLMEMIIVVVIASILGTFVFGVLTKSLSAQIAMQKKKERNDDAIMVMEKISREVKEAKTINNTATNQLIFEKNVTSSLDGNLFVKFIRNTSTNELRRQSSTTYGGLPGNDTSGDVIAEHVTTFIADAVPQYGSSVDAIIIDLVLDGGSNWNTKIYPRNYGL
ncbi:hypothetical protein SCALIN_C17_0117 [Candidatus Scalindua japonica]|uniref:Uncharacterized protein n=1 Tax=Candidatus Scalindua japonica TaxID=1284222 RepID=A0A286TYV3_9BACT|nr:type II secretion system protein [Candidatus Scalindua japonica]GAX61083.1 hypothetical protein SCALIN_C17_0117 [Candidatus Scalindua japonica]